MIYRAIVKRKARGIFAALSRGDWQATTADLAEDVHHVFPGDNALGGERHSREAFERWFERLYRLIPEIEFEVRDVAVRGWPWDTAVAVEWGDRGRGADGTEYENEGAHWIRLRWGKATEVHAYLDTEKVTRGCWQPARTRASRRRPPLRLPISCDSFTGVTGPPVIIFAVTQEPEQSAKATDPGQLPAEAVDATRRTHLANERTQLAWWRTGLTALAVALGVGRVVPELDQSATRWPYVVAGVGFALWGIVAIGYGTVHQSAIERALKVGQFVPSDRWPLAVLTVGGLALGLLTAMLILLD